MTPASVQSRRPVAWAMLAALVGSSLESSSRGDDRALRSAHFVLLDPSFTAAERTAVSTLRALESWYRRFVVIFGREPDAPLPVLLHEADRFHAATGAPSWSDGQYDGALHLALVRRDRLDRESERILGHELAHAFIHAASGGRAPRWLHEGLARLLTEGPASGTTTGAVAPGLDTLDHDEAHHFVSALALPAGPDPLIDALRAMAGGQTPGSALAGALGEPIDEMHATWAARRETARRAALSQVATP